MNPPLAMTTSITNGIHNLLRTLKIANPLRLHSWRYVSHSSMQLHVVRDTPDDGTSSAVRVAG